MDAVIEENEVGKFVNSIPMNRFVVLETLPHRSEEICVGPQLGVTLHAYLSGGEAGRFAGFNRVVTKTAIDTKDLNMVLVTERNGLVDGHPDFGGIRRSIVRNCDRAYCEYKDNQRDDQESCEDIRALVKDLRHGSMRTFSELLPEGQTPSFLSDRYPLRINEPSGVWVSGNP